MPLEQHIDPNALFQIKYKVEEAWLVYYIIQLHIRKLGWVLDDLEEDWRGCLYINFILSIQKDLI